MAKPRLAARRYHFTASSWLTGTPTRAFFVHDTKEKLCNGGVAACGPLQDAVQSLFALGSNHLMGYSAHRAVLQLHDALAAVTAKYLSAAAEQNGLLESTLHLHKTMER